MNIVRTSIWLGAASFILMSAVPSYAKMGEGHMMGDEKAWGDKVNKMYDQLDLTQEQRDQLKAQKESHRQEAKDLREKIKAKNEEFRNEIQKAEFDEGKLKAINNDIKSLHNQMADQRLDGLLKVRTILTPEQFTKFMELKEEHRGEWKDKFKEGKKKNQ